MSALLDLLARFPNARITIRSGPTRRKPQVGDRRHTKRHGWQIRRRQTYQGMDCSRNGRPVYEWVGESSLPIDQLDLLRRMGQRGGLNPFAL